MSTRTSAPPRKRQRAPAAGRPRSAPPSRASRATIDPRIRARRVEVARAAGRRRLRRLLVGVVLIAVSGVAALVLWSPIVDVDRVVVSGADARATEVRAAADVERGSPLLLLDTGSVEERVEELAWVGDAEVVRELPGTLHVTVRLRPPVAFAPRPDGGVALVDATGIVTAVAPSPPGGVPALVTAVAPPNPARRVTPAIAARVAAALGPLRGRVARISVDREEAALLLTDGLEVRLGDLTGFEEKARSAAAVLGATLPPGTTYVDVRVPRAPVTG